jgi:hypothetical protein
MWIQHFFSFVGTAFHIFFDAIGTTPLGRIVDIAFGASLVIVALAKTNKNHGLSAMIAHWKNKYRSALKFSAWCALIIYSPIMIWCVGKAVYEDHQGLVKRSSSQRAKMAVDAVILQRTKDECSVQTTDLKVQGAKLLGANGQLQGQNRDQQNTINNCQSEAIKLLAPRTIPPYKHHL